MKKDDTTNNYNLAIDFIRDYNKNIHVSTGKQPLAYSHSFGCQQNVADGHTIDGLLLEMGFNLAETPEESDIIIYNTCAVRENAENTLFGTIGNLKIVKKGNPSLTICVCGCMTQQKHILDKIKASYNHVDLVFGAGAMHMLPKLLYNKYTNNKKVYKIDDPTIEFQEYLPTNRDSKIKANVTIMSGCNNFCSYCVVPYVRGRERSRLSQHILGEITQLVENGYKEITLLGQNVNSYGNGIDDELSFSQLLEAVANIPGKFRIRFMTSHPKDCTPQLLDVVAKYEKISKHIHLPIQSGSNRILQKMNRGYTAGQYLLLVDYAKSIMPEIAFTSDIIVGFPGETPGDFNETLQLVSRVGYSALYTFAYSPRKGTKAEQFPERLAEADKKERFRQLIDLQRINSNNFNSSYLDKEIEVLIEEPYEKDTAFLKGRSDNNILVMAEGNKDLIGSFVNVKITGYRYWTLEGEII